MHPETEERLRVGFVLDSRWFGMKFNQGDRTKERTLHLVVDILNAARLPYAIVGGVALQVHSSDPRTTVDIDIALADRNAIPEAALRAAGFRHTGSFEHSDNWRSGDDITVQFSAGARWQGIVDRAEVHEAFGRPMRFLTVLDLVRAKLLSATDPSRRRSKALIDAADIEALLEEHPEILAQLTEKERGLIDRITTPPAERG